MHDNHLPTNFIFLILISIGLISCRFITSALPTSTSTPSSPKITIPTQSVLPLSPPSSPDYAITIGETSNTLIKPLLGVNAGPAPAGNDASNADLTEAYRQSGVNLIRTHDFYGPLDMAAMYPDRMRDPANPQSYNFRASDTMWQAIVNGGFEPYFRLGDSWNNARPPESDIERANWVRAAVEVIHHYRQAQWDGFTTPFRFVEIWNEPNLPQFWPKPHTALEYFQLYTETAQALKQAFPDLLIGGAGLAQTAVYTPQGRKWTEDFLIYIKQNKAPLDFFSWHLYSNNPQDWIEVANFYRAQLDRFGFNNTSMHVTEWNTDIRQFTDQSAEAIALRTGGRGAAILTAAWIAMQEHDIAVSTFYRGPDPAMDAPTFYGMFYADGKPKRIALAFSLWSKLAAHPLRRNISSIPQQSLWVLAGQNDDGEIALLLANPTNLTIKVAIMGLETPRIACLQVNDASDQIQSFPVDENIIEIGADTVQLLLINQ